MILAITHRTRYFFDQSVFLEPHYLLFRPQQRPHVIERNFSLTVKPSGSGISERLSEENNSVHQVWFDGQCDLLEITADIEVELQAINPFHFFIDEAREPDLTVLQPYLQIQLDDPDILEWLNENSSSRKSSLDLLLGLNQQIADNWEHIERQESNILRPEQCYAQKSGSCRDLSWMLIAVLRQSDIPARFVSGYAFNPDLGEGHQLHAWAEAYLPGAGWIGLDPATGMLASDGYVPVATSYLPAHTLPVKGNYRGDAKSSMEATVEIKRIDQ